MDNQNNNPQDSLRDILRAGVDALGGKADQASDYIDHVLKNVQIPDALKSSVEDLAAKGGEAIKGFNLQGAIGSLQNTIQGAIGSIQNAAETPKDGTTDTLNLVLKALDHLDNGQLTMVRNKIDSLLNRIGG